MLNKLCFTSHLGKDWKVEHHDRKVCAKHSIGNCSKVDVLGPIHDRLVARIHCVVIEIGPGEGIGIAVLLVQQVVGMWKPDNKTRHVAVNKSTPAPYQLSS